MNVPPQFDAGWDAKNPGHSNLFFLPHRIFRRLWMTVIADLDRLDWQDQEDVRGIVTFVQLGCDGYIEHNEMESSYFLPLVAAKDEAEGKRWKHEHEEHIKTLNDIKAEIARLAAIGDNTERRKDGQAFLSRMHRFLGEDLLHMDFEENDISARLAQNYPEAEIKEIEARLLQNIKPGFMQAVMPFMLIASDVNTFLAAAGMVHARTKMAPPQAWAGFCAQAKVLVAPKTFNKVLAIFPALDGTRRD